MTNDQQQAAIMRYMAKTEKLCQYLGVPTGEKVECQNCTGKTKLKVFSCSLYGGCTPEKVVTGLACCRTCTNYTPKRTEK